MRSFEIIHLRDETGGQYWDLSDASRLPLWALCGTFALAGLCLCGMLLRRRRAG